MIKNIILIFLTILSIVFGALYMQEKSNKKQQKEYSERLERKIQNFFIAQINGVKQKIEKMDINLKSTISLNQENEEYVNLLQTLLEEEKSCKLLEKSQLNKEDIDIKIFKYKKILQGYKDLKNSFESVKKIIKNKNKEKDIISKVIQKNNEIESNEESNNQVKIEELNAEEPVKVVFYNSNIKSEEENNLLKKLFDKLENVLNIYTTLNEEITPEYNLLKFVRECRKIIKEQKIREIIHEFIQQRNECRNLEDIYTTQRSRSSLDKRVIIRQGKNVVACYEILETLTYNLEDTQKKLVVEYQNFSSNFNNLGEKDLLYFRSIFEKIDKLSGIIAMEKKWISLKLEKMLEEDI